MCRYVTWTPHQRPLVTGGSHSATATEPNRLASPTHLCYLWVCKYMRPHPSVPLSFVQIVGVTPKFKILGTEMAHWETGDTKKKNTKQSRAASWTWPASLSIKTSQNTKHNSAVFTSPSPPPDWPVPGAGLWHLSRIISCSCGISASLPSNMLGLNVGKCTNQCLLSSPGASQLQPDTQLVNETSRNRTRHPKQLFMRLRGEEACIVCIVRPVQLSNPARRTWQICIKSKWVIK